MTVMTNTEPRFADSKLVEIAKPKVETKTLILPQGKKKMDTPLPSLCFCNKLFRLCCAVCVFCTGDELNSTDNNNNILKFKAIFYFGLSLLK